jgi:hypothetical protein
MLLSGRKYNEKEGCLLLALLFKVFLIVSDAAVEGK